MMDEKSDMYRDLQVHLDQFPIGLPATPSGIELSVLKHLFTNEEAFIATKLDWSYKTLDEIHENVKKEDFSLQSLEETLENMAKKGTIKYKTDRNIKIYNFQKTCF